MIVFSDLHLCEKTAGVVFGEVLPGILEAAVKDVDGKIAFLGDWYHTRYRIPVSLQNQVSDWILACKRQSVSIRFLPGNHDQIDIAGENALEVFQGYENVRVYTRPTVDTWGVWIPYRRDLDEVREALRTNKDYHIKWMHHGVQGAVMGQGIQDTSGLQLGDFESVDRIFCGYYH